MAKSPTASDWMANLPFVLLGIRSAIRDSSGYSPAYLTYGAPLRLPGDFLAPSKTVPETSDFVSHLRHVVRSSSPFPLEHHASQDVHLPPSLLSCTHVFVRVDAVKHPLTPPYCGPYKVLEHGPKVFVLDRDGKPWTVSVDRLKPLLTSSSFVDPDAAVDPPSKTQDPTPPPSVALVPPATSSAGFPALPATSTATPLSTPFVSRAGKLIKRPDFLGVSS